MTLRSISTFRLAMKLAMLPVMMLPLAGCPSLRLNPTRTIGLNAEKVVKDVCILWTEQSYDSELDSAMTVDEIRIKNTTRNAFCAGV